MNERIRELAEECRHQYSEHNIDLERFADMIINICIDALWTEECRHSDLAIKEFNRNADKIWKKFGVE